jgi:hypothetical protein
MASQVRTGPQLTQLSAADDPEVELMIRRIVAQNAGHGAPVALARAGERTLR